MKSPSPESLRQSEQREAQRTQMIANGTYAPAPFEGVDFHGKYDHEVFRLAMLPAKSHFWILMKVCGLWGTAIMLPSLIFAHLTGVPIAGESFWEYTYDMAVNFYSWILGVPLILGITGHIVVTYFTKI
jgi:hypothetical protein